MTHRQKIISSNYLRSILALTLLSLFQVYPYFHVHHSHGDVTADLAASSQLIAAQAEHSSDHHHHDDDSPDPTDHQHTYDKHIDWHILRLQNTRTTTHENDHYLFTALSVHSDAVKSAKHLRTNVSIPDHRIAIQSIIRGPPLA